MLKYIKINSLVKKSYKVHILSLTLVLFSLLFSIPEKTRMFDETFTSGLPVFRYNIVRLFNKKEGYFDLNIQTEINNERLHFIKKSNDYISTYVISVAVFERGKTDEIPLSQNSEKIIFATEKYSETQLNKSNRKHNYVFTIPDGSYSVVILIKDQNSNKQYKVKKEIEFSMEGNLAISDLQMVSWNDDDNFLKDYTPNINNIIDKKNLFTGALFEIYSLEAINISYNIEYRITDSKGLEIYKDTFKGLLKDNLHYQVLKIPLEKFNIGNYKIELKVNFPDQTFERESTFYLRWKDLSLNISDISTAIEQMLYIIDYDSLKPVFNYGEEEKKVWFQEYWNDLELSLSLKKNSLMEEYYRRISFANINFSIPKKEGWKTDMGKVLSLMGDPDEVQSYSFTRNSRPYEVWIYYEYGAQYIFDYIG
ncbi:MAG: GWxTD domain-containing protein, partial [Candidatus Delongbacteria bacterium]|nr:GWxTD domain-containing protein [Candidatus Delongbacteria bacterium]